jgi:hypothetical protein
MSSELMRTGDQPGVMNLHVGGQERKDGRKILSDVQRVQSLGVIHDKSEYEPYGFPISLNLIAVK